MFMELTSKQLDTKMDFIKHYMASKNAADGSLFDANANVENKNSATMSVELFKDCYIQVKRRMMVDKLTTMFGSEVANEYIKDIKSKEIYIHDETSAPGIPYCVSISLYPFLLNGTKEINGISEAPKHLDSFCGSLVNLVFAVSSQFAGAIALPEAILAFNYYAEKDYGENYLETHLEIIKNRFQEIIYCINQPATSRGFQCVKEDTELLTPSGFKKYFELNEGDDCYVWDNGKMKVSKIQKINVHDFSGDMLSFQSRDYKQTVTPNHRMVYKQANTGKILIREAEELFGHSSISLPISCLEYDKPDYPISDEHLKLTVFALTDGTIDVQPDKSPRFGFYKSENRFGLNEFKELCKHFHLEYKDNLQHSEFGDVHYLKFDVFNSEFILSLINYTKKSIPSYFLNLSRRQAKIVIDLWSRLDGCPNKDKSPRYLQCDSKEIADSIQHIAMIAGYGSNLDYVKQPYPGKQNSKSTIYVTVFKRNFKSPSKYVKETYTGKVWCPTTQEGVVIFREDGKTYISGNSTFSNFAIFDQYFFHGMFEHFKFPDGSSPNFETFNKLQKFFLQWLKKEREKILLTFPVVTIMMKTDPITNKPQDVPFADFIASEMSEGNSFFLYQSPSVDSLSSCCRLRNEIDSNEFSSTLGCLGVMTGSVHVITMNMNRIIQRCQRLYNQEHLKMPFIDLLRSEVYILTNKIHKYHAAFRSILEDFNKAKMLPVYDAGFITLKKQFSTIGINGMVEGCEFLGIKPGNNEEYIGFVSEILKVIYHENKEGSKKYKFKINMEFVPAENLGYKNAKNDALDGLFVPRKVYNSYFFPVESESINVIDKFILHGNALNKYLDGGSALHLNLEEHLTKEQYLKLFELACKTGCNYWCVNVRMTVCNTCQHIDYKTHKTCPKCHSEDIDYATRIIGYLKRIRSFSQPRQIEASKRFYDKG